MSSAVVMPVFNEESTIGGVLDAVAREFDGLVVVVDDGSTDKTPEALAARPAVRVLRHARNQGYGSSLADGFAEAHRLGVRRVVTMDCDGQHEPKHIRQFFEALQNGIALVSGSRYLPGSRAVGDQPPQRRDVNARVTAEINRVTGWGLTDAFCGMKAYRIDRFRELVLREPGYGFPLELWAHAFRAGIRPLELPIERIYFDGLRSFGSDLDDPQRRLAYYLEVWTRALEEQP